jgi:hypothetical protein
MTMKKTLIVEQLDLPFREASRVDAVLGRRRKSVGDCEPIDFSECQLAKRYPDITEFLGQIREARIEQKTGGKLASLGVMKPRRIPVRPFTNKVKDAAPWEAGPTAADVRRAYETTHRGR